MIAGRAQRRPLARSEAGLAQRPSSARQRKSVLCGVYSASGAAVGAEVEGETLNCRTLRSLNAPDGHAKCLKTPLAARTLPSIAASSTLLLSAKHDIFG